MYFGNIFYAQSDKKVVLNITVKCTCWYSLIFLIKEHFLFRILINFYALFILIVLMRRVVSQGTTRCFTGYDVFQCSPPINKHFSALDYLRVYTIHDTYKQY